MCDVVVLAYLGIVAYVEGAQFFRNMAIVASQKRKFLSVEGPFMVNGELPWARRDMMFWPFLSPGNTK